MIFKIYLLEVVNAILKALCTFRFKSELSNYRHGKSKAELLQHKSNIRKPIFFWYELIKRLCMLIITMSF